MTLAMFPDVMVVSAYPTTANSLSPEFASFASPLEFIANAYPAVKSSAATNG